MVVYVEFGALLVAVLILYLLFGALKNVAYLVANSVMGIIIFLLLNIVLGIGIPINLLSVGIVAIGGTAGVFLVLVIHFLGLGF
ncbi:MAG: pro-sigmaK processing inhibitor BofA family protein [Candidatus Altiarchaeota archaeon]